MWTRAETKKVSEQGSKTSVNQVKAFLRNGQQMAALFMGQEYRTLLGAGGGGKDRRYENFILKITKVKILSRGLDLLCHKYLD